MIQEISTLRSNAKYAEEREGGGEKVTQIREVAQGSRRLCALCGSLRALRYFTLCPI